MNEDEVAAGLAPTPGYRYADVVGNELFVAGQVPHDATGEIVLYVVGEHRSLLDAWDSMTRWWSNDVPPATLLGVNSLGYSTQLVEIDARIVSV